MSTPQYSPQEARSRREVLVTAKRQAVFLVSLIASILALWPERYKLIRDACIVLALAWLTALAFDFIAFLDGAWEDTPYWMKLVVPVDINDVQITTPFEHIHRMCNSSLASARSKLHRLAPVAKYWLEQFGVLFFALLDWLLPLLGQDATESHDAPNCGPAPTLDQWVGILVATPPEHDYGLFGPHVQRDVSSFSDRIAWESYDMPSIPSTCSTSTFRVHLSFCLVSKTVWDSSSTRLVDKLKSGLYWEKGVGDDGEDGTGWTSSQVRAIKSIEVLGTITNGPKAVDACHNHFSQLCQDWDYKKISWNDVDFAIILGFLVTGSQATTKCQEIFSHFAQLRVEQALVPRRNAAFGLSVAALGATILTGGLAAPITAPLFIGGLLPEMELEDSDKPMSARDAAMWQEREEACQKLLGQFPQLEAVFRTPDDPFQF